MLDEDPSGREIEDFESISGSSVWAREVLLATGLVALLFRSMAAQRIHPLVELPSDRENVNLEAYLRILLFVLLSLLFRLFRIARLVRRPARLLVGKIMALPVFITEIIVWEN